MSNNLKYYHSLEKIVLDALQQKDEDYLDYLYDKMDEVWKSLTEEERSQLNQRVLDNGDGNDKV